MKKLVTLLLPLIIFFSNSCKSFKKDFVTVKISAKNIPADTLYLAKADNFQLHIDSVKKHENEFIFKYKISNDFEPFIAILHYKDSLGRNKALLFKNDFLSTTTKEYAYAAFVLEQKDISISGDFNAPKHYLHIEAGDENEILYRNALIDFGFVSQSDPKREEIFNFYINEIKKHPSSYVLLNDMYYNRGRYSKKENLQIAASFDKKMLLTNNGKKFEYFIKNMLDSNENYPALILNNINNIKESVFRKDSRYNLLIFWASWCGPCRQEIPSLKELYSKFGNKGVTFSGISIDEESQKWKSALAIENMPWNQYLIDSTNKKKYEAQFRVGSIPLIILTDSKGKELIRISGYSAENKLKLEQYLKGII